MENYYLTETTTSIDDITKSFEYLITNSTITSRATSDKFKSTGEGIISENFYIGNNLTRYLNDIEVLNSSSCILTIPKSGKYSTKVSNQIYKHSAGKLGGIVLPTDRILYKANTDVVDDLIIIIKMDDLKSILIKKYNITNIDNNYIPLNVKKVKVSSVCDFIESTIKTARYFPHLRDSLLVRSNIKEIATLIIADLIADYLNISPDKNDSLDLALVRRAEEFIENECEKIFTIQEIALQLFTSPRSLQKAFKKYRHYTPIQFLKNRKLYKAHKLLINKNDPMSVKKAALSVGILDLSRFSKYYTEIFGELPSKTIEKSRK